MLATDRRYDVITEEPPLVHTAGVVNLYSRDFYELCVAPPRRRRDPGRLARHLGAGGRRDADARARVRGRVPPHVPLGLHAPRGVAPPRIEEAPAGRPRRARGAHGVARDRSRPRPDRRGLGRDPDAGRPPVPLSDGARRSRRFRRRHEAGHRRPVGRRLHDTAPRPRQLRLGGVGDRRVVRLRGGGARPAERARPARLRSGLHVPRAGRADDCELRRSRAGALPRRGAGEGAGRGS